MPAGLLLVDCLLYYCICCDYCLCFCLNERQESRIGLGVGPPLLLVQKGGKPERS